MAATPPSNANPTGSEPAPAGQAYVPITFEDKLQLFWKQNRGLVLGACAVVLVAIVGKGIWEHQQEGKQREIQAAFQAANTPDKRAAFVKAHPDHPLAAVAEVQAADEAYAAGKPAEAIASYDKALAIQKSGPLSSRALLGRAVAKAQSGKTAEAIAEMKQLAGDTTQLTPARSEAAYHLASLSIEAGNTDEAEKAIAQLNQIDPASIWARRATALQAQLPRKPAPAETAAAPAAGAPSTTTGTASAAGGPNVQVKLPSK